MKERDLKRILEPLYRRIMQVVARAVIKSTDDSGAIRKAQIAVMAEDTLDGVDQIQEYGFTSRPLAGAQAVVITVNGSRDHPVIIATDDGRYRVKLENGEACLYDDQGQFVKIARAKIDITTPLDVEITAGGKVKVTAPNIEANASVKIQATSPEVDVIATTMVSMTTPLLAVTGLITCAGIGAGGAAPAAGTMKVSGSIEATGDVSAVNVAASGNVNDSVGSMAGMRTKYNSHAHGGVPDPSPQM